VLCKIQLNQRFTPIRNKSQKYFLGLLVIMSVLLTCALQEMLGLASILTTQIYTYVSCKKLTQAYNDTHPSGRGGRGVF